ncbi:MAG: hypothetical protein ACK46J_03320 [Burkholderiales bacterium]|jgi:ABC-type branched-subunit amino acid transport system permease subunit
MNTPKNRAGSYSHFPSPMKSYVLSVIAILCCAVPAAIISSWTWKRFGLEGVPLAIATVMSAMVLATALFAMLSAIGKALKVTK